MVISVMKQDRRAADNERVQLLYRLQKVQEGDEQSGTAMVAHDGRYYDAQVGVEARYLVDPSYMQDGLMSEFDGYCKCSRMDVAVWGRM